MVHGFQCHVKLPERSFIDTVGNPEIRHVQGEWEWALLLLRSMAGRTLGILRYETAFGYRSWVGKPTFCY